ncbi:MAG TPA: amidohydrolase family protein [Puia sp.]|nr:amidohydrolase family protein [Puia sp.]
MKIDAHQHFWSTRRPNDYGFLTKDAGILYHDYFPADLEPCLKAAGMQYTVLVQAAETEEETQWLLDLVKETDFVAGVVGWVNFDTDAGTFVQRLDTFRENPRFIGVRPMLQDLPDDGFILRPRVLENLKLVASLDLPFDILIYPKHLPPVYEMLQQVPGLRAVIDHLAKPPIRDNKLQPWLSWMQKISKFPNVWCKLSGMVTEADHKSWKQKDLIPYVRGVVDAFGSERLMFGSDWPVCLQAASYQQVYDLTAAVLDELSITSDQRERIFGGNAAKFYKLDDLTPSPIVKYDPA